MSTIRQRQKRDVDQEREKVQTRQPGIGQEVVEKPTCIRDDYCGAEKLSGRPGQPCEVPTCYVFLASADGDYLTGEPLHPNGGRFLGA